MATEDKKAAKYKENVASIVELVKTAERQLAKKNEVMVNELTPLMEKAKPYIDQMSEIRTKYAPDLKEIDEAIKEAREDLKTGLERYWQHTGDKSCPVPGATAMLSISVSLVVEAGKEAEAVNTIIEQFPKNLGTLLLPTVQACETILPLSGFEPKKPGFKKDKANLELSKQFPGFVFTESFKASIKDEKK